jgi:hypothetical protein
MKKTFYVLILAVIAFPIIFSSCLGTEEIVKSDDAKLKTFAFAAHSSISGIESVVFTIDDANGVIYNIDSLAYQTVLNKLLPVITTYSTSKILINGSSTAWVVTDSIDFSTTNTATLRNYAEDGVAYKDYTIKVNVHQVDPDVWTWSNKIAIHNETTLAQVAYYFSVTSKGYVLVNNAQENLLWESSNGKDWSSSPALTNIPGTVKIKKVVQHNNKLYLWAADKSLWVSTDGTASGFEKIDGVSLQNLLFSLNGKLWGIKDGGEKFVSSALGYVWTDGVDLPFNFPTEDYSSITYKNSNSVNTGIVVGGQYSNYCVWSTQNGTSWINYSNAPNYSFPNYYKGSTIFSYDGNLYAINGTKHPLTDEPIEYFYLSENEGLTWTAVGEKVSVPTAFERRKNSSVIVDASDFVWFIGGESALGTEKDVWVARKNKLGFLKK